VMASATPMATIHNERVHPLGMLLPSLLNALF